MSTVILRDGQILEESNLEDINDNSIAYFYNSIERTSECEDKKLENSLINIHEDIVIRNKDFIMIKVPFIIDGCRRFVDIVLDHDLCIVNYEDKQLVEFIKEKIALYGQVDKFIICLLIFQYFLFLYRERLLKIEGDMDNLYEKAVEKGVIDNRKVLHLKKSVALIKRYVSYYESMITYLDDEFKGLELYDKTLFVVENTANLVNNVESEIYSCVDIYNSVLSNKMNKTMQLLTVITVSFMPLSIVTGIFGMNFQEMPLLSIENGFYLTMGITGVVVILELIYFKFKKFM